MLPLSIDQSVRFVLPAASASNEPLLWVPVSKLPLVSPPNAAAADPASKSNTATRSAAPAIERSFTGNLLPPLRVARKCARTHHLLSYGHEREQASETRRSMGPRPHGLLDQLVGSSRLRWLAGTPSMKKPAGDRPDGLVSWRLMTSQADTLGRAGVRRLRRGAAGTIGRPSGSNGIASSGSNGAASTGSSGDHPRASAI